ncbi:MAG TPA: D-alanyl-D-alanine carboxypeptidase/D-alanyl-D-alanine-endopeptidase [Acidobacteriota bacterium]|nr:D-alanyl-D-alanine carboxypeptidase/D-alanyl-D-alanine-endopeptidase [Acidobacteriota bacterium]
MPKKVISFTLIFFYVAILLAGTDQFEKRLQQITGREPFKHAIFGIRFLSLETKKPLYSMNADKFFIPASTTKLITTGSAVELFGPDHRFKTYVYRTGPITSDGNLQGDLILMASGDPNLSGRLTEDGTLAFENSDHSYGGEHSRGVAADPIKVIRNLAKQVAEKNVKRISGRVIVDASLFPQGERELGTGVVISPMVVNDNVVDVLVAPGASEKLPAVITVSPVTSYVRVINKATTGTKDSQNDLRWDPETENGDGSYTITLAGTTPVGGSVVMFSYPVPDPARYGEVLFTEALRERGIIANPKLKEDVIDYKALSASYTTENRVAEHISAPMSEEAKVILKVSQNLHASMMPYLIGSLIAKKEVPQSGFDLMREFLTKAGLNVDGASQGDGAGGSANFTPEFMTNYLAYMSTTQYAHTFHDALPILGKDGTLFQIQVDSVAAGHVFAKTGTYTRSDPLHNGVMIDSKALAGYMTTKSGKKIAFALFVNHVPVGLDPNAVRDVAGQAMGEIAAAAYEFL